MTRVWHGELASEVSQGQGSPQGPRPEAELGLQGRRLGTPDFRSPHHGARVRPHPLLAILLLAQMVAWRPGALGPTLKSGGPWPALRVELARMQRKPMWEPLAASWGGGLCDPQDI